MPIGFDSSAFRLLVPLRLAFGDFAEPLPHPLRQGQPRPIRCALKLGARTASRASGARASHRLTTGTPTASTHSRDRHHDEQRSQAELEAGAGHGSIVASLAG